MQSAQELIGGYLGQKISAVDSLFTTMPSGHIMVFQQCYNLDANSFFFLFAKCLLFSRSDKSSQIATTKVC